MTDLPSSPDDNDAELLASLYIDGEATAEERSLVEGDPQLMALVEVYRAQAASLADVAPPPELRSAQLAAALDLFDDTSRTATDVAPSPVTSLADGRRRRDQRRSGGLPTWLGAAAAAVLVVGGLGFVASNLGSNDDDSAESTEVALNPSSGARRGDESDAASDDAGDAMEAEMLAAEPEMAGDAASVEMADDAMEDDAMEEEAAEESEDVAADDALADGDDTADQAPPTSTTTVPATSPEPVVLDDLAADTAADYLTQIVDAPRQDTDESPCADAVSEIGTPDGFISVILDGQPAELHVLAPEGAVIVSNTCEIVLS